MRRIATFETEDSAPASATLMREDDYSNDMVAIESRAADVSRAHGSGTTALVELPYTPPSAP